MQQNTLTPPEIESCHVGCVFDLLSVVQECHSTGPGSTVYEEDFVTPTSFRDRHISDMYSNSTVVIVNKNHDCSYLIKMGWKQRPFDDIAQNGILYFRPYMVVNQNHPHITI